MKVIVYHDTEFLAKRSRHIRSGETISYRDKKDWCEDINKKYDEIIDLSTPKKKLKK